MDLRRAWLQTREGLRLAGAVALEALSGGPLFLPVTPQHRRDPYLRYRRLRERDPVHRNRAAHGWVVSRYADVVELLRDPRLSADDRNFVMYEAERRERVRAGLADPDAEPEPVMLRLDPPAHTRLRGLVSKAFTPRAIEKLRPRVEALAEELLDAIDPGGPFDLLRAFAVPLPVTIIAEMLGIPARDREQFKRWSDVLVGFLDPTVADPPAMRKTAEELDAYITRIAEERRRVPADDLLSGLVLAEEAGDRLSPAELRGTVALLLAAGNETTTNLIGNGMLALLRHPEALARLCAEPEGIPSAVEELLRYDSPVQLTGRIPVEDFEFRGRRFRRGQMIVLLLGSANRDPDVFPDPDRLDVSRQPNRHLSFGIGNHFCLGAGLARLEAQVAIAALLRRFPRLALADGEPDWAPFLFLRGLRGLRVVEDRA